MDPKNLKISLLEMITKYQQTMQISETFLMVNHLLEEFTITNQMEMVVRDLTLPVTTVATQMAY